MPKKNGIPVERAAREMMELSKDMKPSTSWHTAFKQ